MSTIFGDVRVRLERLTLNGHDYACYIGLPQHCGPIATVFLLHGWPDLAFGWRHQMPMLLDEGFRVVAPDMMGYGDTAFPPASNLRAYTYKSVADDLRQLACLLNCTTIVLGGHDWGAQVAWRVAQWHPHLVSHLFSIAGPYRPPATHWIPLDDMVKRAPQFAYQKQIASGILEREFHTTEGLTHFLNILDFSGDDENQASFDPTYGFHLEHLKGLGRGSLLTDEERDIYLSKYAQTGLHGPCNWYRTRRENFEDDQLLPTTIIDVPVLYIAAERDRVFSASLAQDMEHFIPQLSRTSVDAHHYAHMEKWQDVNRILSAWLHVQFPR
ncbi:uncharacterized protein MYCGRDRAFT_45185 [Zymoseptoria tritici IPO323]|uniref:AB hydrolase-1 domain-containing protein n=1 Tax=Zymoseptoria tritici (strain CBS 115943 / IPO323) TaxID=336722 RepID=F9XFI9_ZYMTI|nr:uncharacterized protein MYCGRDRAFT_45185 [Zymoseptoria tritici IPO323]EGP85918.1 hypothetical protein MYCGRDRAFT_45185 [Zymoseptoria tritici IPO323]